MGRLLPVVCVSRPIILHRNDGQLAPAPAVTPWQLAHPGDSSCSAGF